MSRGIWFVAGAGVGVYAVTRARRVAEAFTSEGLRDRLAGLAVGARLLRDEVRAGQQESETQLRERLGLVPHGIPELGAADPGPDALAGAPHPTDDHPEGTTRGHR
ncbi:DUF6167 family protein [uncultured Nocardioides sp.]|uniref:Secreted protein n=1 Tax=uncultured Nocardioides sp. TaxID=198441 RepID=A0A6J4PM70_9ACTN|nr:DUF6167 family protein [uncultured Nocardioides sp.]CAA9419285.1 MAG: hypothetical protein AVDCRST_MAG06-3416 [uncultured Nocardioides sp.]